MRKFLKALGVSALAAALSSCSMIGPLTRSTTSLISNFGDLATTAASSGAF